MTGVESRAEGTLLCCKARSSLIRGPFGMPASREEVRREVTEEGRERQERRGLAPTDLLEVLLRAEREHLHVHLHTQRERKREREREKEKERQRTLSPHTLKPLRNPA